MIEFVVIDAQTEEIKRVGSCPENMLKLQASVDEIAVHVPAGVVGWPNINLEPYKAFCRDTVNDQAGKFRLRFITDIPGQPLTYFEKEAQAKAWTEGADHADYPYLAFEAEETGMSIGDVAALTLATAAAWRTLAARVEGRRRGAIVAVNAGTTLMQIWTASQVDFEGLLA